MISSWEREGNEAEAHGEVLGGIVLAGVEGRRRIPAKKRRNRRRSCGVGGLPPDRVEMRVNVANPELTGSRSPDIPKG